MQGRASRHPPLGRAGRVVGLHREVSPDQGLDVCVCGGGIPRLLDNADSQSVFQRKTVLSK